MTDQNITSAGGAQPTESSPLLSGHNDADRSAAAGTHFRRRVILVTFTMFFFLEFGAGLLLPAQAAALEQKICNEKYSDTALVDRDCKTPDVQGDLALLKGWLTMLECVPGKLSSTRREVAKGQWCLFSYGYYVVGCANGHVLTPCCRDI